jgi:hypothetical protein
MRRHRDRDSGSNYEQQRVPSVALDQGQNAHHDRGEHESKAGQGEHQRRGGECGCCRGQRRGRQRVRGEPPDQGCARRRTAGPGGER